MAQAVQDWYTHMPINTHSYLTAAVVITVGCSLEVISLYNLYLNPSRIVKQYEFSSSATFMMVYVWSKRNPFIHMSFLGKIYFCEPFGIVNLGLAKISLAFTLPLLDGFFAPNNG